MAELTKRGFVRIKRFKNSNHKPAYAYLLTPRGIEEKFRLTADFLRRKMGEYEALRNEIEDIRNELAAGGTTPNLGEPTPS